MHISKRHEGEGRREGRVRCLKFAKMWCGTKRNNEDLVGRRGVREKKGFIACVYVYGGLYVTGDNCARYTKGASGTMRGYTRDENFLRDWGKIEGSFVGAVTRRTRCNKVCTCDPVTRRRRTTRDRRSSAGYAESVTRRAAAFGCWRKTRGEHAESPEHDNGT